MEALSKPWEVRGFWERNVFFCHKNGQNGQKWLKKSLEDGFHLRMATFGIVYFLHFFFSDRSKWDLRWIALDPMQVPLRAIGAKNDWVLDGKKWDQSHFRSWRCSVKLPLLVILAKWWEGEVTGTGCHHTQCVLSGHNDGYDDPW